MNEVGLLPLLFDLFESLPMGVVVLDEKGKVVVYNRAEEKLAGRKKEQVLGREFFVEIAPCLNVRELGQAFSAQIGRTPLNIERDVSFPFPFLDRPRDVHIKLNSFQVGDKPFAMLLIEDVSVSRSVERMKETLQSLLIHDLKNPLAVMLSNLSFIKGVPGLMADPDAVDAVTDTMGSARRLQAMLLNLLDITRMETGTLPLKSKEFDLRQLLVDLANASRGVARAVNGSIRAEDAAFPMPVRADPEMLRRALENLVDNAFRHAKNLILRTGGTVSEFWVELEDDGPGIPEALRSAIFEKYG